MGSQWVVLSRLTACRAAFNYLLHNPDDLDGAREVAATYCLENCGDLEWEWVRSQLRVSAGGVIMAVGVGVATQAQPRVADWTGNTTVRPGTTTIETQWGQAPFDGFVLGVENRRGAAARTSHRPLRSANGILLLAGRHALRCSWYTGRNVAPTHLRSPATARGDAGLAAPANGPTGMGVQYKSAMSAGQLEAAGYLEDVTP
jgi:hypothetical protein